MAVAMLLLGVGCASSQTESGAEGDAAGTGVVELTAERHTVAQGELLKVNAANLGDDHLFHGSKFRLERLTDEGAREVPPGVSFGAALHSLGPGESTTIIVRTQNLEPGRYRVSRKHRIGDSRDGPVVVPTLQFEVVP